MTPLRALILAGLLVGCTGAPWNDPYPAADAGANTYYSAFTERPKHLDPVQSYSENEATFTSQVYQPPLQYHYYKRPYELIPQTAVAVPRPMYLDAKGERLPDDANADAVAYSVYEIRIRPGILYQPHPAFAEDASGRPRYRDLKAQDLADVHELRDFAHSGTRELTAADYVHQIKRLAHPRLHSPIFGLMSEYIVGLKELSVTLKQADERLAREGRKGAYLDLTQFPLAGAEVVDRHTYRIKLKGKYPQFGYWLAMPFFAPVPEEAERFFAQPGMAEKNLTLDWYPVGTGPFMLTVNNPNRQMILERNPNFKGEVYPSEGEAGDGERGLLRDAGKPLPFLEKAVYSLEKESIPYWNKVLQGYYDASGIGSDTFDQAVAISSQGDIGLTDAMQDKGIRLATSVAPTDIYMGFNMLDPVVGGDSERARKLRRAISVAMDYEEYIAIFANGRGVAAQGPIPPAIFGHRAGAVGINRYVYDWVDGRPQRKSIEDARRLLAEAGYPDGIESATGKPLVLNLDVTARGPDDKARLDWIRKQFAKLNLQLVVRATDYNRFQDKIRKGNAQIFQWGWNGDYPDPENFLFLLYGPQSRAKHEGENSANYANPEYDRLFERMRNMENGPERQAIIDEMLEIARRDAPWVWGLHPKEYNLFQPWVFNQKPNQMARNGLKYVRIDPQLRQEKRREWNAPVWWPLALGVLILLIAVSPAWIAYRRRERRAAAHA
jgi:ABC-type transport system substrate-binding protein